MEDKEYLLPSLYQRRLQKERTMKEDDILSRMRWDLPVLSSNYKCSVSLDLPLANCIPTDICSKVCYAAQGRQYYRKSVVKALAINRLINLDPEHVARKMVDEATGRRIRIAGSGELLLSQVSLLSYVERLGGSWYGITRRIDTHRELPSLMFSIDATTPAQVVQYVQREVPAKRRTYLRRPEDPPSPLEVAVTFPVHGSFTNYANRVPLHETDCPADRKKIRGCWSCGRCF